MIGISILTRLPYTLELLNITFLDVGDGIIEFLNEVISLCGIVFGKGKNYSTSDG